MHSVLRACVDFQASQSAERACLGSAFQRVKDVEARRILLVRSTIETFQQAYK